MYVEQLAATIDYTLQQECIGFCNLRVPSTLSWTEYVGMKYSDVPDEIRMENHKGRQKSNSDMKNTSTLYANITLNSLKATQTQRFYKCNISDK